MHFSGGKQIQEIYKISERSTVRNPPGFPPLQGGSVLGFVMEPTKGWFIILGGDDGVLASWVGKSQHHQTSGSWIHFHLSHQVTLTVKTLRGGTSTR